MSFTLSLDELIVTYFTASAGTRTLPLEIFGRVKKGLDPTLNAISTVFIASTVGAGGGDARFSSDATADRRSRRRRAMKRTAFVAAIVSGRRGGVELHVDAGGARRS